MKEKKEPTSEFLKEAIAVLSPIMDKYNNHSNVGMVAVVSDYNIQGESCMSGESNVFILGPQRNLIAVMSEIIQGEATSLFHKMALINEIMGGGIDGM